MPDFGWSYPPGAANDPNAPWNALDPPCEVCGEDCDECKCPECPTCGSVGELKCYKVADEEGHGLRMNYRQLIGQEKIIIANLQDRLADCSLAIDELERLADGNLDTIPQERD